MNEVILHILEELDFMLKQINSLEFDDLLDVIIQNSVKNEDGSAMNPNDLAVTDKIFLRNQIWDRALANLYKYFLPNLEPPPPLEGIEITPYTVMLCRLVPRPFDGQEIYKTFHKDLKLDFLQFEIAPEKAFREANLQICLLEDLPPNIRPNDIFDRLGLFVRLMNFPPLTALNEFFDSVFRQLSASIGLLRSFILKPEYPDIEIALRGPLHYTKNPFTPDLLKTISLSELASNAYLQEHESELIRLANQAATLSLRIEGTSVCSSCGDDAQGFEAPLQLKEWYLISQNTRIFNKVAFIFLDDMQKRFLAQESERLISVIWGITKPEKTRGFILVEGKSDVNVCRILAWKLRLPFHSIGITIVDCEGKNSMADKFLQLKKIYPKLPIVCVLDKDGESEREAIERMIRGQRNKYAYYLISQGTIEDTFPIKYCVQALNIIYPDPENNNEIELADFDPDRDFIENADKVLLEKRQIRFDNKVAFGKWVALLTPGDEMPLVLREAILKAVSLIHACQPLKLSLVEEKVETIPNPGT